MAGNSGAIRFWAVTLALAAAVIVAAVFSLSVGSAGIPAREIIGILKRGRGGADFAILFDLRLPRIMLAIAVGGALSLAGVILQSMFRNPLVEPYTLGISGGAGLFVALCISLGGKGFIGGMTLPAAGFFGAASVILVLYVLALEKGNLRIHVMLLAGVMLGFISSSAVMLLLAVSGTEELHGILYWTMGSLSGASWKLALSALLASVIALIAVMFEANGMNALLLGEDEAKSLGIDAEKLKKKLFFTAALLTGISVASAGVIGFVGLLIPHFVRALTGPDHRRLVAASFFGGALFLILSDTAARTVIAPIELPVGVITGICGGLLFLYVFTGEYSGRGND